MDESGGRRLTSRQSQLARAGLAIFAIVAALGLADVVLRIMGHRPYESTDPLTLKTYGPSWSEFDRDLGWVNRAGFRSPDLPTMTVWANHARATRATPEWSAPQSAVMIGCSYTQGETVGDADTFAWKLQERFPMLDVTNLGTGGYGGYQSLLALERFLQTSHKPIASVVYGFAPFHAVRDRATASAMAGLRMRGQVRAFVPPHVDVDDSGLLVRSPGRFIETWPLSRRSALANLLQEELISRGATTREDGPKNMAVQFQIMSALKTLVEQQGGRFLVAALYWSRDERAQYLPELERQHVPFIDCAPSNVPPAHPDAFWHTRHADCIEAGLRQQGVQ